MHVQTARLQVYSSVCSEDKLRRRTRAAHPSLYVPTHDTILVGDAAVEVKAATAGPAASVTTFCAKDVGVVLKERLPVDFAVTVFTPVPVRGPVFKRDIGRSELERHRTFCVKRERDPAETEEPPFIAAQACGKRQAILSSMRHVLVCPFLTPFPWLLLRLPTPGRCFA